MDIRERRKRLDLLFPRIKALVLDVGFANVIQNELDVRTLFHEPNGIGELWVEDTDIEAQSIVGECFNAAHKVGLDAEIHAFGLDEAAYSFDERVLCQFFDERCYLFSLFEGCPCDNALNPRFYCCCEGGNPCCLFQTVIGMCIALDKDDGFDVQFAGRGVVIF
jgi:hypothetical protein